MKLLVVQDDPPLQATLLRLLVQWGYGWQLPSSAPSLGWSGRFIQQFLRHDPHDILMGSATPRAHDRPLPSDSGVAAFVASLTVITLISLGLGYDLRERLSVSLVSWLASALFLSFALKLLVDTQLMRAKEAASFWPRHR